jgi:predicted nucleic acid-binding protein
VKVFFDTNIFVYSVSVVPEDEPKRRIAVTLLEDIEFHLSLQVVQEFLNTCLRKAKLGQNREALRVSLDFLLASPCHLPNAASVRRAFEIQGQFHISYWDAAILAAAQELGCDTLYTEDLNHGQDYGGVVVKNPFF